MKVISFSLFGTDPIYTAGAVANARLAKEHFPGWTCRFYVGPTAKAAAGDALTEAGAEVVDCSAQPQDWSALLWRFETLADPAIEAHLFRDCDSRLSAREAAAVAEWEASGQEFHIIRDHPEHNMLMMAGMWGCTAAGAARVAPLLPTTAHNDHRFVDQLWLRDHVYPTARNHALIHGEFHAFPGETPRPIPAPREAAATGFEFVGQAFDADGQLRHPDDAWRLDGAHEWRLFDEGTVPEYTLPGWYVGREHAPHLEQAGHRERLMLAAAYVAQAAFSHRLRTVVDLGAGDGGLLSLLGPGLRVWGYDLMPANIDAAKERGVDVRLGDVVNGNIDWAADIAVCTEMLEHLVDPHGFVRRIATNCRALVCSSPADERPGRAYEFHTWAWDETGYRALVEQAGFTVKASRRVNRFQVLMAVKR